jgi:mono/diheme cytochrome c family protein
MISKRRRDPAPAAGGAYNLGMRGCPWVLAAALAQAGAAAWAHDLITTSITFSREISRIIYAKCAACHRPEGSAFSLLTYKDARPWAVAIKEEVLRRNMPPWGAVKGFGDFRNDGALTPEEIELIVRWTEGGVPEGDPKDLPQKLPEFPAPPEMRRDGEIVVSGDFQLTRPFTLDALAPREVPEKASFQMVAQFPGGRIEPLLWLHNYDPKFPHAFVLRRPLELPRGTIIRGVPAGAAVALLPPAPHRP